MASSAPAPADATPTAMRPVLPSRGVAVVKSVLSGDTAVLLGRPTQAGGKAPEVTFTFERVTSPRMGSKANNNVDEPGAFPSREWLRSTCVGKSVHFETRKQGASAGDRVYGLLFVPDPTAEGGKLNLAVESVRRGFATPKVFGGFGGGGGGKGGDEGDADAGAGGPDGTDSVLDYEGQLVQAHAEAKAAAVGVHAASPLVRKIKNAGEDFAVAGLVEKSQKLCAGKTVKCVIEYVFDGSRFRCMITDTDLESAGLTYGSYTLILAGVACPRTGNPRASPPSESEPFADEARTFVDTRLLQRELQISLHGTDKSGGCAVGTIHHPRGSIGGELLKRGYARVSEWSARLMSPLDLPAFRVAENTAKQGKLGVWHSYEAPKLSGEAQIEGTVIEVISGDTLSILPTGVAYDDDSKLQKISLASVRSPRVGNERIGRPDEPYAVECKDRLRLLVVGKPVKVSVHYERDIPMGASGKMETRRFGTVSVKGKDDVGRTLIQEGYAVTQRHRDDDEKSPSYDQLVGAESTAATAKRGSHSDAEYKNKTVNDFTQPIKAKGYSSSLQRSGSMKAVVEYVFNGSRFKLFIPSENCHVIFALSDIRCPMSSPPPGRQGGRAAEPFGDAAKRHARLSIMQRNVEVSCNGCTNGGVLTGQLHVGTGATRRDFSLEMVTAGLGTVDQRKIDWGEAPQSLVDAQDVACGNKTGLWSIKKKEVKVESSEPSMSSKVEVSNVSLSEIRAGNNFYFRKVGDESAKVIDDSMKEFTTNNGTDGAPCDTKVGKVVAALFDDGSSKSWYRAKIAEKQVDGKIKVVFVDHGNAATVPLATHLRPLDDALGLEKIPAVAKEAMLAATEVRALDDDEGHDAAVLLQQLAWGKEMKIHSFCEAEGKVYVAVYDPEEKDAKSVNEQIVSAGLGRVSKRQDINALKYKMKDSSALMSLASDLGKAQDKARKSRTGMWRYGDVGEDDEEER